MDLNTYEEILKKKKEEIKLQQQEKKTGLSELLYEWQLSYTKAVFPFVLKPLLWLLLVCTSVMFFLPVRTGGLPDISAE